MASTSACRLFGGLEPPSEYALPGAHKNKTTAKPVIFGASDGRRYEGQKRTGVSLFDFVLPKASSQAHLYGYGPVPGLVKKATGKRSFFIPFIRAADKES